MPAMDPDYPDDIGFLNRKLLPTAASCGNHPLTDVSGPTSTIDGTPANSYKYCIPRNSNECVNGSALGQIYVNCPGLIVGGLGETPAQPYGCNGNGLVGSTQLGVGNDVCIHNAAAYIQNISQFSTNPPGGADFTGFTRRALVSDVGRIRMSPGFDNARLLPYNSWLLFGNWWSDLQTASAWMAFMPPATSTDGENRATFQRQTLSVPGMTNYAHAIMKFGYLEYGAPDALNCTTRADACVANQMTVPTTGPPFVFASEVTPPHLPPGSRARRRPGA